MAYHALPTRPSRGADHLPPPVAGEEEAVSFRAGQVAAETGDMTAASDAPAPETPRNAVRAGQVLAEAPKALGLNPETM